MAATIGSLNVDLSIGTARFKRGLSEAQAGLSRAQKQFEAVGGRMQGIGSKLSVGLSAPLAGIGAAFMSSAKGIADTIPQLEQAARLANTSTANFQKLAYAAKTVGIESDKLGDIYKDVNDKVGEFLATGGGEMRDFFTNVAPKVGVTAEAFRNLSGPDALGLYVSSLQKAGLNQQEMTYYMEAVADEATALLPLLKDNGKAMQMLGDKANIIKPEAIEQFKRYNAAQAEMEQSFQKLTVALVSSGLLESVTDLVTKAADLAGALSKSNPELIKWGLGIGTVATALGPVLYGVGTLTKTFAPLLARLAPLIGVGGAAATGAGGTGLLGIAGALGPIAIGAAAVVVAYKNWDKIAPWIDAVAKRMSDWATKTDAHLKKFTDGVAALDRQLGIPSQDEFLKSISRNFTQSIARIDEWLLAGQRYIAQFDAAVYKIAVNIPAYFQRMVEGIGTWLGAKLGAIWNSAAAKIQWIADKFKWLDDVVVRHSYIPDMVDSIGDHMRRLQGEMVDPAQKAIGDTERAFGSAKFNLPGIDGGDVAVTPAGTTAGTDGGPAETAPAGLAGALQALRGMQDVFGSIGGKAGTAIGGIADILDTVLTPAADRTTGAFDQWGGAIGNAQSALNDLATSIFGGGTFGKIAGALLNVGVGIATKGQGFGGLGGLGGTSTGMSRPSFAMPNMSSFRQPMSTSRFLNPPAGGTTRERFELAVRVDEGAMFRTTVAEVANQQATAVVLDRQRTAAKAQRNTMGTGRR